MDRMLRPAPRVFLSAKAGSLHQVQSKTVAREILERATLIGGFGDNYVALHALPFLIGAQCSVDARAIPTATSAKKALPPSPASTPSSRIRLLVCSTRSHAMSIALSLGTSASSSTIAAKC